MPTTILFDNSALNFIAGQSNLDDATRAEIGRRMRAAVKAEEKRVIVNFPALGEIAGVYFSKNYERFFPLTRFVFIDCNARLLLMPVDFGVKPLRHLIEVRAAGKQLGLDEVVMHHQQWNAIRKIFMLAQRSALDQLARDVSRRKQLYATQELRVRAEAEKELAEKGQSWSAEFSGWESDPHAVIDEWTAFEMQLFPAHYGLPEDRSRWPPPRAMRSLWYARGYAAARLREIFGDGRRCNDGGDLCDALYFEDAAYADMLVTGDDGLARRGLSLRIPELRILLTEEWIAEVLDDTKKARPHPHRD